MAIYLFKSFSSISSTLVFVAALRFSLSLVSGDSAVVEVVERRSSRDIYSTIDTTSVCQQNNQLTYLVDENTCVNNEDLMRGTYMYNL